MAIVRKSLDCLSHNLRPDSEGMISVNQIRDLANQAGISTVPFGIEEIINKFGIKIVYDQDMGEDLSGYIENRSEVWVIGVNKYQSSGRQRFTLAHEFAHFLLHKDRIQNERHVDRIFLRDNTYTDIEKAADQFAGELLIPESNLKEEIHKGIKKLAALARVFDVSIAAIRFRARKLGLTS